LASAPSLQARSGAVPHLTSISSPAKVRVPPHFSVGRRREKTRHEHEKFVTSRDRRFRKRWAQKPRRDTRTSDCLPDFLRAMSRRDGARRMRPLPRRMSACECHPQRFLHRIVLSTLHKSVPHVRKKNCERRTQNGHDRVSSGPPAFCISRKKVTVVCTRHSECSCERNALKNTATPSKKKKKRRGTKSNDGHLPHSLGIINPAATFHDPKFWAPSRRSSWQLLRNSRSAIRRTLGYNCSRPRQHAVQGHTNL